LLLNLAIVIGIYEGSPLWDFTDMRISRVSFVLGFQVKDPLPAYFKEKGKSLATTERSPLPCIRERQGESHRDRDEEEATPPVDRAGEVGTLRHSQRQGL